MAKKRTTLVSETSDAPLVEVDENAFQASENTSLDTGLLGAQISPGFCKVKTGCPITSGGVNLIVNGGGPGVHQHWQKFCTDDRTMGYWQNVTGQVNQYRKANPIAKLVEEQ